MQSADPAHRVTSTLGWRRLRRQNNRLDCPGVCFDNCIHPVWNGQLPRVDVHRVLCRIAFLVVCAVSRGIFIVLARISFHGCGHRSPTDFHFPFSRSVDCRFRLFTLFFGKAGLYLHFEGYIHGVYTKRVDRNDCN
jgi:hypothetical protein